MICLSCFSEFEYPKILDDDLGSVMEVCPVCGSPDISISQSDALVFQDELDRVGLESFGRILPEDVKDAVIDLLHGRMLIRGLYFKNLNYGSPPILRVIRSIAGHSSSFP